MRHSKLWMVIGVGIMLMLGVWGVSAGSNNGLTLLLNYGFEERNLNNKPTLTPWVLSNKSGDAIECFSDRNNRNAANGSCHFRFSGSSTEKAVLKQTVSAAQIAALNELLDQSSANLYMFMYVKSASSATDLRGKMTVTLTNGQNFTLPIHHRGSTNQPERAVEWVFVHSPTSLFLAGGVSVKDVKFSLANKSKSGKAYVDDILITTSSLHP